MSYTVRQLSIFLCLVFLLFAIYPIITFATTAKIIVKNAYIFTMAPGQLKPLNGYLIINDDGIITQVGSGNVPDIKAKKVIDAHGYWIIPGFISAHSHLWQAAYRGIAANKSLKDWGVGVYKQNAIKAKPEDFYWFTLLGGLDHLEHGITTAYNFTYSTLSQPNNNIFDEYQFRGECESGIRFIHGYRPEQIKPGITMIAGTIANTQNRLRAFLEWIATQPKSSAFLGIMINSMATYGNTPQQSMVEAALMKELQMKSQAHYLEPSTTQGEERSKFRWFMDSGMLSPQLIFGHFIHVDDFILEQTAKAGAAMCWNPLSNGRLASGIADIPKYLKKGIHVGMGVDGEASADLADPFENMRMGLYTIRSKYEDATVLSPYQMLWLHTMGSADVLGIKNKVGSLEPGKFGDFLIINPKRLGIVLEDPYANLVLVGSKQEIDQVYIGGTLLVIHNKLLHQDLRKVQAEVNERVIVIARKQN